MVTEQGQAPAGTSSQWVRIWINRAQAQHGWSTAQAGINHKNLSSPKRRKREPQISLPSRAAWSKPPRMHLLALSFKALSCTISKLGLSSGSGTPRKVRGKISHGPDAGLLKRLMTQHQCCLRLYKGVSGYTAILQALP